MLEREFFGSFIEGVKGCTVREAGAAVAVECVAWME